MGQEEPLVPGAGTFGGFKMGGKVENPPAAPTGFSNFKMNTVEEVPTQKALGGGGSFGQFKMNQESSIFPPINPKLNGQSSLATFDMSRQQEEALTDQPRQNSAGALYNQQSLGQLRGPPPNQMGGFNSQRSGFAAPPEEQ